MRMIDMLSDFVFINFMLLRGLKLPNHDAVYTALWQIGYKLVSKDLYTGQPGRKSLMHFGQIQIQFY